MQTFFALYARQIGRKSPIVESVPVELYDLSVSEVKGERISFKGVEFEVPWDDVDEGKTRIAGSWLLIHFRSGNSIILCVNSANGFIDDISKSKTPDPELFKAMYGPEVLRSDYALHNFRNYSQSNNTIDSSQSRSRLVFDNSHQGHHAANDRLGNL
jgi:hypothetical protein